MEEINISSVASLLNLRVLKKTQREVLCVCPICGDERGKFSYNESKNKFNCFHCDERGGAITLYMRVMGISSPNKAASELYKALEGETAITHKDYSTPEKEETPRKSEEYLIKVYEAYLKKLFLRKEHKADLLKRGLTEKQIKEFGYKSVPKKPYFICKELIKEGYDLEGVPGFIKQKNGSYTAYDTPGYYCPVFNKDGRVIGFQVRVDEPKNGAKYLWFSSPDCSCGGLITFLKGTSNVTIITEGINKATITYALLNGKITLIGVPGIKVLGNLKSVLKDHSNYVFEAYDMDKAIRTTDEKELLKSKRIENAAKDLRDMVDKFNIPVSPLSWDFDKEAYWKGNYKGIDNFLLAYGKENIEEKFIPYLTEKARKKLNMINYFKKES